MADSIITKKALAASLRDLMTELPFEKIQVSQICDRCGISRKSFYYHFKDKYDLLNWIFDTEFHAFAEAFQVDADFDNRIELLQEICNYFYENRDFYSKALKSEGQNSFPEHVREYCLPLIKRRLTYLLGENAADDFAVNFFTDACMSAIERWLTDSKPIPAEQFVSKLKVFIQSGAVAIQKEWDSDQ